MNRQSKTLLSQLRQFYPTIELVLLKQTSSSRVSLIESKNELLIYAVSQFNLPLNCLLLQLHQEIIDGAFIGETILKHGFQYEREVLATFKVDKFILFKGAEISIAQFSKIFARKDDESLFYCYSCEILNPTLPYKPNEVVADEATIKRLKNLLAYSPHPITINE